MSFKVNSLKHNGPDLPLTLRTLNPLLKGFNYAGAPIDEWIESPKLAVVGSRKISPYGQYVTRSLTEACAKAGIVIISGLAYGVDAAAHIAALEAGGITVAILPTSIENLYPTTHLNLARRIIESGGSLISEYSPDDAVYKSNFTNRNRIVAALADALLITEAAINSGTFHTVRFALEQGKTVMAVPGNINSSVSEGCNNLIKSGAIPVTEPADIFLALGLTPQQLTNRNFKGTPEEKKILDLIKDGVTDQEELALRMNSNAAKINSALTILEINGFIKASGAGHWINL